MAHSRIQLSFDEFRRLSRKGNLIPVSAEVVADALIATLDLSAEPGATRRGDPVPPRREP